MNWTLIPYVRRQGEATVGQIAEAIGESHARTLRMVIKLIDEGKLIDLGGKVKAATTKYDEAETPPIQAKLWKVFHALDGKGLFTARDAARLAETDLKYARAYLKWAIGQGFAGCRITKGRPHQYWLNSEAPPVGRPPRWRNTANTRRRKAKKKEARRAAR